MLQPRSLTGMASLRERISGAHLGKVMIEAPQRDALSVGSAGVEYAAVAVAGLGNTVGFAA